MYQFTQPPHLILEKNNFEQWCSKINTLQQMVTPTTTNQQLTSSRNCVQDKFVTPNNNETLIQSVPLQPPQPQQIDEHGKFQTSKMGGNKLWQLSTKNIKLTPRRPSFQLKTFLQKAPEPISPSLSSQFDLDLKLKQIVKFIVPKEKYQKSSRTYNRLPHRESGSDHHQQPFQRRVEGQHHHLVWDSTRQTNSAHDSINNNVSRSHHNHHYRKKPRKNLVTGNKSDQITTRYANPRSDDSEDECIMQAAANIMVMSTYNANRTPKDRGSIVTQHVTENESEASLMFKKGMGTYDAIISKQNQKPYSGHQSTKFALSRQPTDQSPLLELKTPKLAMSQQTFSKIKQKHCIVVLKPKLEHQCLIKQDFQSSNAANKGNSRTNPRKRIAMTFSKGVAVKEFEINEKVSAQLDNRGVYNITRAQPINTKFQKGKPIFYPTTGVEHQFA